MTTGFQISLYWQLDFIYRCVDNWIPYIVVLTTVFHISLYWQLSYIYHSIDTWVTIRCNDDWGTYIVVLTTGFHISLCWQQICIVVLIAVSQIPLPWQRDYLYVVVLTTVLASSYVHVVVSTNFKHFHWAVNWSRRSRDHYSPELWIQRLLGRAPWWPFAPSVCNFHEGPLLLTGKAHFTKLLPKWIVPWRWLHRSQYRPQAEGTTYPRTITPDTIGGNFTSFYLHRQEYLNRFL